MVVETYSFVSNFNMWYFVYSVYKIFLIEKKSEVLPVMYEVLYQVQIYSLRGLNKKSGIHPHKEYFV